MRPIRNGVRFPIRSQETGQPRPAGFADSGEKSMAAAAERYNRLRAGTLGIPPSASSEPEETRRKVPSYVPEDAIRGCMSLGLKRHEAEQKLRFLRRPWPDDLGELIGAMLRS